MLYLALPPAPPPIVITLPPQKEQSPVSAQPTKASTQNSGNASAATASNQPVSANASSDEQPENLPASSEPSQTEKKNAIEKILAAVQKLISLSLSGNRNKTIDNAVEPSSHSSKIASSPSTLENTSNATNQEANSNKNVAIQRNNDTNLNNSNSSSTTQNVNTNPIELAKVPGEPFLVGVVINGREVGTLDLIQEGNTLLIPLEGLAEIAGFTVEQTDDGVQAKTPLGVITLEANILKQIKGVTYISNADLQTKLSINLELNTADLTLLADLPWRGDNNRQSRPGAAQLKPEFLAPSSAFSNLRQELNISSSAGDTSLRSSTLLGGRLLGGAWLLRLDNNFVQQPDITEYFFYKRQGQFRYQVGRQQVGLHPLLNGLDLTGLQFGYSNLPADSFNTNYGANELLPRRSRPIQSFRGQAPPASFVQLRVGGIVVAQQQVGFNGEYEFIDVNLPVGQSNEIEVLIFDRNNLRVPMEIRSVRINASDLLLPARGNMQLAGLGFSGNLAQDTLFRNLNSDYEGKFVGFYQLRQGLSPNLTFEGSAQAVPDTFQTQAGLIWRLANPIILSASVGNSDDKVGYSADLDVQLDRLEIYANSQSLPRGFRSNKESTNRFNHSLELKYRFNNKFNLGFIARNRKDDSSLANYILPTFSARPFYNLSLNGRPDIDGRYLFNAFYQASTSTRLSFNTYGNAYLSDLSYNFTRDYQVSLGTEFGGNLAPRYSLSIGRNPSSLRELSWNLGLAYSDGEIGPLVGASMQVLPGLFGRLEYQGIPSRTKGNFGGFGDDRLSISLVSDLSFAGGRIASANSSGLSKERGAISGRLVVEGQNKGFNLSGSTVRVLDKRNQNVGAAKTDSKGNFFVGNLPEGVYIVELESEELPVELSLPKTSTVASVAPSAVTRLNFPLRPEYGVAGRISDIAGAAIALVRVELVNAVGVRVLSTVTDQYGLYRFDGVPVGRYILRVSPQDSLNSKDTLPKRPIFVDNEFAYNQDLQLPVAAAALKQRS